MEAKPMDEWVVYRLAGEALDKMAEFGLSNSMSNNK
jgi:hypothetical protein